MPGVRFAQQSFSSSIDFASPLPKRPAQLLDTLAAASFTNLLTSTPAVKSNKNLCNENGMHDNDANFSNILKTSGIQLMSPLKIGYYNSKNNSDEAVHSLNNLSLDDDSDCQLLDAHSSHDETNIKQKSLQHAHVGLRQNQQENDNSQFEIIVCDNSSKALNSPSIDDNTINVLNSSHTNGVLNSTPPLEGTKSLSKNSIKDQTHVNRDASSENKENVAEQNQSFGKKVTFRKRKTLSDGEKPRKTLDLQTAPKKSVGFTQVCDRIHELTNRTIELSQNVSHKLFMKSGKWRRTIYDLRKSKLACKFYSSYTIFLTTRLPLQ